MVVLASQGVFGGGAYRTYARTLVRVLGKRASYHLVKFPILITRGGRLIDGEWLATAQDPFMPERADQPFHPGGNSLCYALQWAHLMGAERIFLLGFTLASGLPYEVGPLNPVTGKPSFYRTERPLDWLRWFERQWPGRAQLFPGWQGPVYDVFRVADLDQLRTRHAQGQVPEAAAHHPWLE